MISSLTSRRARFKNLTFPLGSQSETRRPRETWAFVLFVASHSRKSLFSTASENSRELKDFGPSQGAVSLWVNCDQPPRDRSLAARRAAVGPAWRGLRGAVAVPVGRLRDSAAMPGGASAHGLRRLRRAVLAWPGPTAPRRGRRRFWCHGPRRPLRDAARCGTRALPMRRESGPPRAHDLAMMERACAEAERGRSFTSPNPLVGAVVVDESGPEPRILSVGHHARVGADHGEVAALRPLGGQAPGATIYVTLEPCNHVGRTGNCCEALLRAGVRRVVVGALDPNPHVAGHGVERLRAAGLQVDVGVGEALCQRQNRGYLRWIVSGRPFVTLKAAVSLDGRLAPEPGAGPLWLTGEAARRRAHELRGEHDAILVGAGTVLADDPQLTVRLPAWEDGAAPRRQPLRVVLDGALRCPPGARLLGERALILTSEAALAAQPERAAALRATRATVLALPPSAGAARPTDLDLATALRELGRREVLSVLCEGGAEVHGALLREGLADEAAIFIAPLFLGDAGVPLGRFRPGAAAPRLESARSEALGSDVLITGTVLSSSESSRETEKPRTVPPGDPGVHRAH